MKFLWGSPGAIPLLLCWASLAPLAGADWTETFTGGTSQSWTFFDDSGNSPPSDTAVNVAGGVLAMQHNSQTGFDYSVAGRVETESFADVVVRATVAPTMGVTITGQPLQSNNDMFVLARSSGTIAYLFALDYRDGDVDLGIAQGLDFIPLASSINNPAWFNPNDSYVLELLAYGTDLRGRVYDLGGELLAELSASDDTLTAGYSGIGAIPNNDTNGLDNNTRSMIAALFDDVSSVAITGDFNKDGVVDAADYTVWRNSLGAVVPVGTGADGNYDGIVDEADYTLWKSTFGSGELPPGGLALAGSTVPEPASCLVIGGLALLAGGCRRRAEGRKHA